MWAEWYFNLHIPDKDGKTPYKELKQYERQTGETPEELIEPVKFPQMVSHVWSAFCLLSDTRTFGMNGPNPISFEQIDAWVRLTNQVIKPRDIEAILAVDRVYLKVKYG